MSNHELFERYDIELILRLNNPKNLRDTRNRLADFEEFLDERPPSADLAKEFLTRYADKGLRTKYRYTHMIKGFMRWYGQPIDGVRVRVPKSLPSYIEDETIEKLLKAIDSHRTHKGSIRRDRLLVETAVGTGMRRSELAALEVTDVHGDRVLVRDAKFNKDRMIPLERPLARKLNDFIKGMKPNEKVFKLAGPSITMKIKHFARKAGLDEGFHAHCLRDKFATDTLESGANIRVLQELMGHENVSASEVYLGIADRHTREAVDRREKWRKRDSDEYDPFGGITPYVA